jgi:hypothetical protein
MIGMEVSIALAHILHRDGLYLDHQPVELHGGYQFFHRYSHAHDSPSFLSHMGLDVFLSSVTALPPVCSGHDICCELGNMGALCAAMSEVTSPRPRFVTVSPPSIPELLRGQSTQSNNGVEPVQSNPIQSSNVPKSISI